MTRDNDLALCNTSMEVWMETVRRFGWTDYIRVVMLALLVLTPGQWCWCRHDQCCVDTGTMACKIDKIAKDYGFTESDSYFGQVVGFLYWSDLGLECSSGLKLVLAVALGFVILLSDLFIMETLFKLVCKMSLIGCCQIAISRFLIIFV